MKLQSENSAINGVIKNLSDYSFYKDALNVTLCTLEIIKIFLLNDFINKRSNLLHFFIFFQPKLNKKILHKKSVNLAL